MRPETVVDTSSRKAYGRKGRNRLRNSVTAGLSNLSVSRSRSGTAQGETYDSFFIFLSPFFFLHFSFFFPPPPPPLQLCPHPLPFNLCSERSPPRIISSSLHTPAHHCSKSPSNFPPHALLNGIRPCCSLPAPAAPLLPSPLCACWGALLPPPFVSTASRERPSAETEKSAFRFNGASLFQNVRITIPKKGQNR